MKKMDSFQCCFINKDKKTSLMVALLTASYEFFSTPTSFLFHRTSCWSNHIASVNNVVVVSGVFSGTYEKYASSIVEMCNAITPTKIEEFQKQKLVLVQMTDNYRANLLPLNLIRMSWYTNPVFNKALQEQWLDKLIKEFNETKHKEDFDMVKLLTFHISTLDRVNCVTPQTRDKNSWNYGNHNFFMFRQGDLLVRTMKDWIAFSRKEESEPYVTLSGFLAKDKART